MSAQPEEHALVGYVQDAQPIKQTAMEPALILKQTLITVAHVVIIVQVEEHAIMGCVQPAQLARQIAVEPVQIP